MAPLDDPRLRGLRALVVDDNAVNRQILVQRLADWRVQAVAVDGGQAALDALHEAARQGRPFQLALLDVQMPGMDGLTVAARMAADPELSSTQTIVLGSSGLDPDERRDAAIAVYLTKPVGPADLLGAMAAALDAGNTTRAVRPAPSAPTATDTSEPAPIRRRVLVAEDNGVNQRIARSLLSKRGHDVTVVGDGARAVQLATEERFDLVLMDVQMPIMNGFDATAAIRAHERERGGHLRIVAMTAHALKGDAERCLEAGMDGYLSKPLDPRQLFDIVEADWEPSRSARQLTSTGRNPTPA